MNEAEILRLLNAKTFPVTKASREHQEGTPFDGTSHLPEGIDSAMVGLILREEEARGWASVKTKEEFIDKCIERNISAEYADTLWPIYSASAKQAKKGSAKKPSTEAVAAPMSPAKFIEENLHESEGYGDFGIDLQEIPEEMRPKSWSVKATSDESVYIHWVTQEECYYVRSLAYAIRRGIYGLLVSNGYSWEALGREYEFTVHLEAISRDGADYGEGEITFSLGPSEEAGGVYGAL